MPEQKRGRGRPPKGADGAMGGNLVLRVYDEHLAAYDAAAELEGYADRADWVRRVADTEAARVLRRHVRETGEKDGRTAELLAATTRRLRRK